MISITATAVHFLQGHHGNTEYITKRNLKKEKEKKDTFTSVWGGKIVQAVFPVAQTVKAKDGLFKKI